MKNKMLSAVFSGLALLGLMLRWLVYQMAVDEKNLIMSMHPIVILLWVLAAATLVLAAVFARKARPVSATSGPAFVGHGLLGIAVAITALMYTSPMGGILGLIWKLLGLVSAPCLLLAGWQRMSVRRPYFALYAAPSLFFATHVLTHYQIWCSNPQFTDYAFALLACAALAIQCYHRAASSVEKGHLPFLKFTALAAIFLCGTEVAQSLHPWLYLGGAVFCLTDLPG